MADTYTQKIPGFGKSNRQVFEFDEEQLVLRVHHSGGSDRVLKLAWKNIPAEFYFRDIESANKGLQRQVGAIAMIAIAFIAVMRNDVHTIWIALLISALLISACFVASRLLSARRTEIPTSPPISVYRGQFHDEIINEIAKRRRDHFAKMASINIEETARSNLRRLDWLWRIRAITTEDYLAFERELVPATPLSNRSRQALPARHFHQEQLLSWVNFEMKSDHFIYERRFVGWGKFKFNFEYKNLRPPKEIYRNLAVSSSFAFALYMCMALCIVAVDLWVSSSLTHDSQAIIMIGLGFLWIAIVTSALCIIPVHVIMAGLYALEKKDGSGDDILHELEVRRRAARKEQFMQSSILLTKRERDSRLSDLRRDDAISELEFHELAATTENIDDIWLNQSVTTEGEPAKTVLH